MSEGGGSGGAWRQELGGEQGTRAECHPSFPPANLAASLRSPRSLSPLSSWAPKGITHLSSPSLPTSRRTCLGVIGFVLGWIFSPWSPRDIS